MRDTFLSLRKTKLNFKFYPMPENYTWRILQMRRINAPFAYVFYIFLTLKKFRVLIFILYRTEWLKPIRTTSHNTVPFNIVSYSKKEKISLYCTTKPSSVDLHPHLVQLNAGSLAIELVRVGGTTHRPQQAVQAGQHSPIV